MTFSIAIIGRPNVGKSTLFNRLVGKRLALVDDQPGLTRDRREGAFKLGKTDITLIDTAGLEEASAGSIQERMRLQTQTAIEAADLVLFLIDARAGLTPADEVFAEIVRQTGKPVILVANKCEGQKGMDGLYEAYKLGFGEPLALSAEHGEGIGELYGQIGEVIHQVDPADAPTTDDAEGEDRPIRVAIVGRPNAGKSTLVNTLLGEERMITGPEAGLTRDTISQDLTWQDQTIRLYDTAGLRKKARVSGKAEELSVGDTLRAIRFAEIVVLLIEPTRTDDGLMEKQDLQIADLVASEGRALIIAVNKWDEVKEKKQSLKQLRDAIARLLPQVTGVPIVPISALKGQGIKQLWKAIFAVYETWNRRIPTAALNRFLSAATDRHPPPAVSGKRIRLRYMTQPNARPPSFVAFCSRPEDLPTSYNRYLINGLREEFDLPGVPIRLYMRKGKNPYN